MGIDICRHGLPLKYAIIEEVIGGRLIAYKKYIEICDPCKKMIDLLNEVIHHNLDYDDIYEINSQRAYLMDSIRTSGHDLEKFIAVLKHFSTYY